MSPNTWYIIINPHAGSGKTMSVWEYAKPWLEKLGFEYVTVLTDYKAHATLLAYEAARAGYRRILAVGGDGSVHEVFNGVLSWCDDNDCDPADFVLGVAPIGSGNDWIKTLGVPNDIPAVLKLMAEESFGYQDVIKITTSEGKTCYMTNIGGVGLDSHICRRVNTRKEAGHRSKFIYIGGLLHSLFYLSPNSFQLIADGKEVFSGDCYSLALGNGMYSGGGLCQVPDAVIDDGILDVTVVLKRSFPRLALDAPRLFGHSFNKAKSAVCIKCRTLDVIPLNSSSTDIIEVDGEIEGTAPIHIAVTGQRIGVIRVK